jgi:dUTP pyrophosphatase
MNPVPRKLPVFKYAKTCDSARPPEKSRISDTGYDLHLIKKIKEVNGVHYFDTCIRVQPEYGYYFDLVGRSSISKTGWTLANNVGIIDMSYRGSIIVALVPSVDKPKDLELPCKLVQLIPRKVIIMDEPEEVIDIEKTERNDTGGLGSNQFLNNTKRGDGGFGSSDKE